MALLQITEPGQAIDPHLKKRAAGIDLGTTNSLIASYIGGELKTLADHDGVHLLPSVVRYGSETITVGTAALAEAKRDPKNTLMSVKRLLGRGTEDLKLLGDQLPYDFANGDGGMPFIKTDFGEISPVEASAEILKSLAARASETLAGDLDGVVITVPAYFDDAQRLATKDAATLAGLNVLRLLSEPTAAAVAYGLDADDSVTDDGIIAVYDLGGGTFDISLLRMNRGVFEVLATGGNSALGGDDFDAAIAGWLLEVSGFAGQISQAQHRTLLIEARGIKEALSDEATVKVNIDSEGLHFQGELTREAFETLIAPLLDQSIKACRRAVRDAGLKLDQIAHVVLVGGSTRVPAVSIAVGTYFQSEPLNTIDPDRVVALGAAVQANILVGNKSDDEMLLLDVLPLSLGLETMGGLAEKVIHRNTTIPVTRGQEFTTYKDGQTAMLIHVVQGERELISDCRSLARFELRGIPPMVAGAAKIQVFFQVDADGLLSVAAREESTGVKAHVIVKPSFGLGEEQVANMLKASFDYAKDDMQSRIVMEARVDAQRVIDAVEAAVAKDGAALLSEAEQNEIAKAVAEVQSLLTSDDAELIDEAVKQLGLASDDFASRRMDASVKTALSGHSLEEFEKE